MVGRHRAALVTAFTLVTLAVLVAPGTAGASNPLVISAARLSTFGLRSGSASSAAARSQLGDGLSADLRKLFDSASTEASAASTRGEQLRSDAFSLRSASDAGRVLTSWSKLHHAGRVKLGAYGYAFTQRSHNTEVAQVLWREGSRLGLVVLTATRDQSKAGGSALAYAVLADTYLKTSLPSTSWGEVLANISSSGTVSEQTALDAFVLAYGPVPGVHPPHGRIGEIPDGTMAAQWVLGYRSKLSSSQLRAVDRLLGLPAPSKHAARVAGAPSLYDDPGWKQDAYLDDVARTWVTVYDSYFHITLPLAVLAGYTTTIQKNPYTGGLSAADAMPFETDGSYGTGVARVCRIRFFPAAKSDDPAIQRSIMAHEVFHCFEDHFLGSRAWYHAPAPWIMEGLAVWGQLTVDTSKPNYYAYLLNDYITSPATPLYTRSYDAVGFWGHVQDTYHDLWSRIPAILNAGSNDVSFHDAGGDLGDFLDTWGSSVFRTSIGGPPWEMLSPIEPMPDVETLTNDVSPGVIPANVEAAPYTTAQYFVQADAAAPMLLVAIDGPARLSPRLNDTDLKSQWFCTLGAGACVCPPMTVGVIPPYLPLTGNPALGLAAADQGTRGTLAAYSLYYFCHKPPTTGPGSGKSTGGNPGSSTGSNGEGQAGSGGDPHLVDFDKELFDFQAAGEFTLLKSTQDNLQVQVRQQPFLYSKAVSVNTAAAMRVGSATVEIDPRGFFGISAYVNKSPVHGSSVSLRGGGHLTLKGPLATVKWADGSEVEVENMITLALPGIPGVVPGLDAIVEKLATKRLGHVEGLLGNWGGSASAEFVSPSHKSYPAGEILGLSKSDLNVRYDDFGNAWRITQKESLFRYPTGKSTSSYTIRGFPSQYVTAADLKPPQAAAGEKACAAITNTQAFDACVLDVGETGDKGFASGDQKLQTSISLPATAAIDLGAGENPPKVVYDPASKDTYVAWLDNSGGSIDVCALIGTARTCDGGVRRLVDPRANAGGAAAQYSQPQLVIQPGGRVVVLADVQGGSVAADYPGYTGSGVVAWSSSAGGATFASSSQGIANGGELLAAGRGETPAGGAIALDGSDLGVYGDEVGSAFTDFSLSAPAPRPAPVPDHTGAYVAQSEDPGDQLASVPQPNAPGQYLVVVVGDALGAPSGCPTSETESTGDGVGVGTPAALQTQMAWGSEYFKPISCNASGPVLTGGGPTGGTIGLLEDEGTGINGSGSDGIYYRRFDTASAGFGAPALVSTETNLTSYGATALGVSQDGSGGVYAIWLDKRGSVVGYSSNDGTSWQTPITLPIPSSAGSVVVAGVAGSSAELAYVASNGAQDREYLMPLSYSQIAGAQAR